MVEIRAVDTVQSDGDGFRLSIQMGEYDQLILRGIDEFEILIPGRDGGVPTDRYIGHRPAVMMALCNGKIRHHNGVEQGGGDLTDSAAVLLFVGAVADGRGQVIAILLVSVQNGLVHAELFTRRQNDAVDPRRGEFHVVHTILASQGRPFKRGGKGGKEGISFFQVCFDDGRLYGQQFDCDPGGCRWFRQRMD